MKDTEELVVIHAICSEIAFIKGAMLELTMNMVGILILIQRARLEMEIMLLRVRSVINVEMFYG